MVNTASRFRFAKSDHATAVFLPGAGVHVAYGRIRSYDSMTAAWHNPSRVAESALNFHYHAHLESATGSLGIPQTPKRPFSSQVRISCSGIRGLHAKSGCDGLDSSPDS